MSEQQEMIVRQAGALSSPSRDAFGEIVLNEQAALSLMKFAGYLVKEKAVNRSYMSAGPAMVVKALIMARTAGADPLAFLESSYAVNGKIGVEATLAVSLFERSGVSKDGIHYDMQGTGDAMQCTAWAIHREYGRRVEMTISIAQAKRLGWYDKSGSFWPKMPAEMLRKRAASWLIRESFPGVLNGMYFVDELRDSEPIDVEAEAVESADDLIADLTEPVEAEEQQEVWDLDRYNGEIEAAQTRDDCAAIYTRAKNDDALTDEQFITVSENVTAKAETIKEQRND